MNFPYKSFITEEDVRKHTGYRLSDILIPDDSDDVVENALLTVAKLIYDYLPPFKRNKIYADANNQEKLALCQLHQMEYIIENGDLSSRNGSSNLMSLSDLRGYRNLSKSAFMILLENGWLYMGV